jgi:hypothetical protein
VPGHHERHHLVAQLPLGHRRAARLVPSGEQHREQIVAHVAAAPPLVDDPRDERIEGPLLAVKLAVATRGQPRRHRDERLRVLVREPEHHVQRLTHRLRVAIDVEAEQCPAHDAQREPHHLLVDVDRARRHRLPPIEELPGVPGHRSGEARDLVAVEARLHEPALPPPCVTLGRQQPVAQHQLEAPVVPALDVVLRVLRQQVADAVGVVDDHVPKRPEVQVDHVPVLLGRAGDRADGVAPGLDQMMKEEVLRRSGRQTKVARIAHRGVLSRHATFTSYFLGRRPHMDRGRSSDPFDFVQ